MSPTRLDEAVARATGDSLQEVRRRGFSIAGPVDVDYDAESMDRPPRIVDWDRLDHERIRLFP
jgi:hypothetical protein